MNVTFDEGKLFYDLYAALLSYVNRKLNVVTEQFSDSREYTATPPEARTAIRDALYDHRELIDQFVAENPAQLSADELEIVGSWKHALVGKFYVLRYLSKYTVFFSSEGSPNKAYGVLGLADPLEEVIGPYLPRLITAVLLPFKGRIIYDGLVSGYNITFGGGIKRSLNEEYKEAKEAFGIITSLGGQPAAPPEKPKKVRRKSGKAQSTGGGRSASGEAKAIAEELMKMTDAFCKEFLNEEYADLCRKLAETLARKRPSPLLQGRLETWACGIVRTIGWVNYLDDRSQTASPKVAFHRPGFRRGGKHRTGQVESHSDNAENSELRSPVDTAQSHGREPNGVDVGGQRLRDGHSQRPTGTSRSGFREGADSVHPRRSGRGGWGRITNIGVITCRQDQVA